MKCKLAAWLGGPTFTEEDYRIVCSKLWQLEPRASSALLAHFWFDVPWLRIAQYYGMDFGEFRQMVSDSFASLREACIRHPKFSRYEPAPIWIEVI